MSARRWQPSSSPFKVLVVKGKRALCSLMGGKGKANPGALSISRVRGQVGRFRSGLVLGHIFPGAGRFESLRGGRPVARLVVKVSTPFAFRWAAGEWRSRRT